MSNPKNLVNVPSSPEDFANDIAALFYSPSSCAKIKTLMGWIRDRDFQLVTAAGDRVGGTV